MRLTLLQILEDRFAKGATIVTSQLPVSKWYEYINEPTLADAISDRLTSNAHQIELKGESLRRRKSKNILITHRSFYHTFSSFKYCPLPTLVNMQEWWGQHRQ